MSLESAIADLVSASTQLTQSVNVTRATVEATRDSVIAQEAPVTTAKDATAASATAATTDTTTTASKLTAAAADYAAQKTTKGLAAVQTSADTELKDRLHRRDPARHPFRGARPSLVMDFVRRECHRNNAAGNLEPVDLSTFMTFTRASTATYVGPDGLIKEAASNVPRYGYDPVTGEALGLLIEEQRTNLLTYSDTFSASPWTCQGAAVIPNAFVSADGKLTMSKLVELTTSTAHFVRQTLGSAIGACTFSLYAKACERYQIGVSVRCNSDVRYDVVYINLLTGRSYSKQEASGTLSYTVTPVGGGIYRISVTPQYVSTSTQVSVSLCSTDVAGPNYGGSAYTAENNQAGVYIWGAQLEAGSFPTSYIPTPATFTGRASTKTYFDSNGVLQTAASGVAVTDYGYVDGRWVSKGLSLEPQATNVACYSSGSNTSGYDSDSTTSVNATTVSGVGLNNFVSTAGFRRRISWFGATLGTGNVVVSLFVAKQTGSVTLGFAPWEGSVGNATTVALDMGTGVGVLTKGSHTTAALRVEDCGSLWRVSVALTYLSGTVTLGTFYFISTLTSLTLGGLQAETGPVATSYIPTTTAQVTRAADTSTSAQVTRAGDDSKVNNLSVLNNDGGSFVFEGEKLSNPNGYLMELGTLTNENRIAIRRNTSTVRTFDILDNDLTKYTDNVCSIGISRVRLGVAYNRLSLRGAILTDLQTTVPNTSPRKNYFSLVIGSRSITPATVYAGGYIRQLTYFPRQLSDADLQALTILED